MQVRVKESSYRMAVVEKETPKLHKSHKKKVLSQSNVREEKR